MTISQFTDAVLPPHIWELNNYGSILQLIEDLEKGGRLSAFFYDTTDVPLNHLATFREWEEEGEENKRWLYAAKDTDTGKYLVFASVNNPIGYTGMCHFCFAEGTENYAHLLAKEWLSSVVSKNALQALYGLTPKPYRHAISFAQSVGFEVIGTLPKACYMAKYDKYVDGIITIYKNKE